MKTITVHATPVDAAIHTVGQYMTIETAVFAALIAWCVYLFK